MCTMKAGGSAHRHGHPDYGFGFDDAIVGQAHTLTRQPQLIQAQHAYAILQVT